MTVANVLTSRLKRTREYCSKQKIEFAIKASEKTWEILDKVVSEIKPGMNEDECNQRACQMLGKSQIDQIWHKPYIRFGKNTLLRYHFSKMQNLVLREDDIAFIDIGLIIDGIEGGAGYTVVFGNDPEKFLLKNATKALFDMGCDFFHNRKTSGIELYQYLYDMADVMGYEFNLTPAGHLIGSYPHTGWKRGLDSYPDLIEPGHWVLEIQIRHKVFDYGGFYESLLI